MTQTFDPTKPCTTRDGRKAVILRSGMTNKDGLSICGIIHGPCGEEWSCSWHACGKRTPNLGARDTDLVNIPPIPKGLRKFVSENSCAEEREWLHMDTLIAYLDKEGLVVVPKYATPTMYKAMDARKELAYPEPYGSFDLYCAAIAAWEEETDG